MINKQLTEVLPLFPSPLFTTIYNGGDLTNTIRFLDRSPMLDTGKANEYGLHSKDTYILENPECKPLYDFIKECLVYLVEKLCYMIITSIASLNLGSLTKHQGNIIQCIHTLTV